MPLFTTIDEIKKYIAIDVNTEMDTVLPFINEAEMLFIKPLLGAAFYGELAADYDIDNSAMTDDDREILPYVQRALAHYMGYLWVPQMGVSVGDMGIQMSSAQDAMPAPRWKVEQLQMSYLQQADIHAEKLLEYLENNATSTKYQAWYEDLTVNTKMEGYLVNNTRVASQYIDINDSRRIFLRLKKRIKDIEARNVKKLICDDQYTALVDQIKTDALTAENTALIEKLRPYIAKMALYLTIPSLRISITDQGITIYSSNDGVTMKEAADKDQVNNLMKALKSDPFGYEADEREINEFIKANIADYPLIAASNCYTVQAVPGPTWTVTNYAENKHFSV